MVKVYAQYEDGFSASFEHVTKVSYNGYDKTITVSEEDIPTHRFPIDAALWLYADDGISVINNDGLRFIEITKE